MTEEKIRTEFSKAMSYPELFAMATKMKTNGEDIVIVNKLLSARRAELARRTKSIKDLKVTRVDNILHNSLNKTTKLQIEAQGDGTKGMEFTGTRVIFK
jgi:hypothetical protein